MKVVAQWWKILSGLWAFIHTKEQKQVVTVVVSLRLVSFCLSAHWSGLNGEWWRIIESKILLTHIVYVHVHIITLITYTGYWINVNIIELKIQSVWDLSVMLITDKEYCFFNCHHWQIYVFHFYHQGSLVQSLLLHKYKTFSKQFI